MDRIEIRHWDKGWGDKKTVEEFVDDLGFQGKKVVGIAITQYLNQGGMLMAERAIVLCEYTKRHDFGPG